MPDYATLKTANNSYWAKPGGVPAWLLNFSGNCWDKLMDYLTTSFATLSIASPIGVSTPISVGASPFTYTAGGAPEMVYISEASTSGAVSSVVKNTQILVQGLPIMVPLGPGQSVVVTYVGGAPFMVSDK